MDIKEYTLKQHPQKKIKGMSENSWDEWEWNTTHQIFWEIAKVMLTEKYIVIKDLKSKI